MNDTTIFTNLSKQEVEQRLTEIFDERNKFNVSLNKLYDNFYLSNKPYTALLTGLKYYSYLIPFQIQVKIKEDNKKTSILITSQSQVLSLVLGIMFLSLIWSVIFGMHISNLLESKIPYLFGGFATLIIFFFAFKTKQMEKEIIEFILKKFDN